jgi:glycosyltransferase involved in cell wall biosynthesis
MSLDAGDHDCIYATSGWGIHDERWTDALREVGFTPAIVSLVRDVSGIEALRVAVDEYTRRGRPALAGPLHTVTRHLVGLPGVVGLSWGHDLTDLAAEGADLTWLAELDGLIVDSSVNRRIAEASGVQHQCLTYLPWGLELDAFPMAGPRTPNVDLGLPTAVRVVLSMRAHEPLYRVADIIDAFAIARASVPDLALVIGHSGSLTDDLQRRVSGLGLESHVRFIGTVDEQEMPALLRMAACYVTASRVDGTSVTLLQAMACGTLPDRRRSGTGRRDHPHLRAGRRSRPAGPVHDCRACPRRARGRLAREPESAAAGHGRGRGPDSPLDS